MLPPHDWDPYADDAHPTACQLLRGCMEQQPLHHAAGGKQLVLQCLEEGYSTSIQAAHPRLSRVGLELFWQPNFHIMGHELP